jgi:formate dehydrogenase subunit gamma
MGGMIAPPEQGQLARFDQVERAVHWTNATLFLILLATGSALYVGPISTLVGRRELVKTIHVYSGLLLPLPLLIGLLLPRARTWFRDDVRRLNRWNGDDSRWLRSLGRARGTRLGKFNPGQKLNAAFVAGAIPVMLATGSIMRWYKPFPLSWRTGATFVHDWIAVGLFFVITGHILIALGDSQALAGMVGGTVDAKWAKRHCPLWYEEVSGRLKGS